MGAVASGTRSWGEALGVVMDVWRHHDGLGVHGGRCFDGCLDGGSLRDAVCRNCIRKCETECRKCCLHVWMEAVEGCGLASFCIQLRDAVFAFCATLWGRLCG
jgi:hypothetical protein